MARFVYHLADAEPLDSAACHAANLHVTVPCLVHQVWHSYYLTENSYPDGGDCHAANLPSVLFTKYGTLCLPLSRGELTLMVVVLPAPLGPSRPKHSCLLMARDSPATATLGPLPSLPLYTCME